MKKFFIYAAAALALASCANDDFLGNTGPQVTGSGNGEISFGVETANTTRAGELTKGDAATKLGNEFVVYGWKSAGWADGATAGTAGSYNTATDVFQNYVVKWVDMAGSTESNTKGWEYVGYDSKPLAGESVIQSIKYWDYSAAQYDFLAWSVQGEAQLQEIKTDAANPYKIHSLVFTAPTADELAKVYVANQVTVKDDRALVDTTANTYGSNVLFTFRNMAVKVRLGIYETVPGYSVKDVKFYTADGTPGDGTSTLYAATPAFATAGTVTVKFNDTQANENDAVVFTAAAETDSKAQFGALTNYAAAEYKEATADYIGRTSNTASMSTGTEEGWTYEFPMTATELNLKVDYTLVSKDGSGEVINVTGASAKVPANYGEWKANYAYTYLFKISDNTNGQTGGTDSPAGLYPITFDACVVDVQDGNSQETITTVATPAITTYQNGSNVTGQSEYAVITGKDIFVTVEGVDLSEANAKLYTAIDLGKDKEGITEETVANSANNDIVLTAATLTTAVETIPAEQTIDNVAITLTKKGAKFTPEANKVYVFEYNDGTTKHYKVIRMVGANNTATYALTTSAATVAEGEAVTVTVKEGDKAVTGAKNYFTGAEAFNIVDNNDGTYTFTAKAGSTGAQTVSLKDGANATSNDLSITVNAYEFAAASVTVVEGGNNTITLNLAGAAADAVDAATNFAITGTGLSINGVTDGKVTIDAASGAKSGKITFSNGGVVVATADVVVSNYTLAVKTGSYAIINGAGSTTTLVAKLGADYAAATTALTSSATGVATVAAVTGTEGEAVVTYAGVGTTNITLGSATQAIECTNFAVTLYTDEACTAGNEETGNLTYGTTYYAKFTNNGNAENVTGLTAQGATLTKKSAAGVYKVTVSADGTATIKYTYKGVTFTLVTRAVGE